jgi:hypothetical protein
MLKRVHYTNNCCSYYATNSMSRPTASNASHFAISKSVYRYLVGLIRWGISLLQGLYLQKTLQADDRSDTIHATSGIQPTVLISRK